MSYDISIKVKVQDKPIFVRLDLSYEPNITYNVKELIKRSSGWNINNCASNGNVLEWAKKIRKGVDELISNPEKYRKYEAKNGWGTVESTLNFYKICLQLFDEFFIEYKELLDCAVVWVD